MDILREIVAAKQFFLDEELAEYRKVGCKLPRRDFKTALKKVNQAIIAEVKYASPKKGNFGVKFSPSQLAQSYEKGGACAVSVLACTPFFAGSPSYIKEVKESCSLPVLWKDFIFDDRQLDMAKRCGADAVLLICSVLGFELNHFVDKAQAIGLEPVVEIFNEEEARLAQNSRADVVLINNRNLRTMEVDLSVTGKLKQKLTRDILVISASGIKDGRDIASLQEQGVNTFLIGESLSTAANPSEAVRRLVNTSEVGDVHV